MLHAKDRKNPDDTKHTCANQQTAQALSDAFAAQWNTRMEQRDFTPQTIQWQDGEAVLLG